MGFDLVADSAPAVRQVAGAKLLERSLRLRRNGDWVARRHRILEHRRDHRLEDLGCNAGPDEVEDDDVLAEAVEDFRTVENQLEMALDLGADARLNLFERLVGGDVR